MQYIKHNNEELTSHVTERTAAINIVICSIDWCQVAKRAFQTVFSLVLIAWLRRQEEVWFGQFRIYPGGASRWCRNQWPKDRGFEIYREKRWIFAAISIEQRIKKDVHYKRLHQLAWHDAHLWFLFAHRMHLFCFPHGLFQNGFLKSAWFSRMERSDCEIVDDAWSCQGLPWRKSKFEERKTNIANTREKAKRSHIVWNRQEQSGCNQIVWGQIRKHPIFQTK